MYNIIKHARQLMFLWSLLITQFLFFSCAFSQSYGLKIKVKSVDVKADSVYIKKFDGKDFVQWKTVAWKPTILFQQKQPTQEGLYLLAIDTTIVGEILISDTIHQQFSVTIKNNQLSFDNSPENSANMAYQEKIYHLNEELKALEQQFYSVRSQNIPEFSKKNRMDSLQQVAMILVQQMDQYRQNVIQQYPKDLISSLIKATLEIPDPPQSFYSDEILMIQYQMEHFFDSYPFEDERLLNTPIANDKFQQYAAMMYQVSDILPDSIVSRILMKAQVSLKTYQTIFETWQKTIGDIASPFWNEDIYIEMLHNAIQYAKIDTIQQQFYQTQLQRFDKNRKGSLIPDFNLMLPDGTKTTMYAIEGELILLYFQNPDCHTCIETREQLSNMELLNQAIEQKKLKVVTVYFEKDASIWKRYLKEKANPKYLNTWNFDNAIETQELYELSVIPFMFLLDQNKRVIEKDISLDTLLSYLQKM